jgi:superfamily II DNA or RNA helicase
MQNLRSHLAGQHVDARGESWIVLRAEPYDACTIVTLRGTGDANLGRTTELITPFDRVNPRRSSARVRHVARRAVLRAAIAAIARAHGWCEPWTAATAQIDLLPWQLEPAIAAVAGTTRLLLADGVGLGKTIQAALILAELRARGLVQRALVLTPASLREQWAAELRDRFALDPVVLDHAALTRLGADLPPDVNPWTVAEIAISSIDLVKRGDVRRALDGVPLDLLIVDEAHHLRPGTDRGALVAELASRVPWVVLATATPHSGDEPAYIFLRALGALHSDGEIATFRRGAEIAGRERSRRIVFHSVRATEPESRLLDETLAYGKALWAEHKAIVAAVICRRAVSSASALLRTLLRRRELLSGTGEPAPFLQSELPWQECDERDAIESDGVLAGGRLANAAGEIKWLDRLLRLAEGSLRQCSKALAIERLLARTQETAIVFSEYRDTLLSLRDRLSAATTLAVIHGGMSARERRESVQQFVAGRARVLLATDAAGEGLNLQQRCRLVINVELPWSPLRLEQRIGRVDRLGQARRVHAIQLVHRGSFEDEVLARFERRVRSAARGLAGGRIADERVAAAIFDGEELMLDGSGNRAGQVDARPLNAATLRRRSLKALAGPARQTHPLYTTPTLAWPLTRSWIAFFECDFHDRGGRLVAREALPFQLDFDRPIAMRRDGSRALARSIQSLPPLRNAIDTVVQVRCRNIAGEATKTGAALSQRLQAILRALDQSTAAPIQVSLFDKRAEQRARAAQADADRIRTHLGRRLDATHTLGEVRAAEPRLIALWPVADR